MKEIKKIGVVGTGAMGQGIILVFVQAGFEVIFYDLVPEQADRAEAQIRQALSRRMEKGKINAEEFEAIVCRLRKASYLGEMRKVDFLIEAVIEDSGEKTMLFAELDLICPPEIIFATNTSSLPITKLANATRWERRKNFIGLHFMNPPMIVTLVEIIRGQETSDETLQTILALCQRIGRGVIIQSKDIPGFICNRILLAAINQAIWAVDEGVGSPEDINKSVLLTVATGRAMPVLELADFIGLDICLRVLNVLKEEFGAFYVPSPLLEEMVREGKLGQKTNQGFFKYPKEEKK